MSYSLLWVVNIYQTISYTYGSDICLRLYVPNTYVSQTLWLETYVPNTYRCVPDNHTLIDLLISYALHVVPSYVLLFRYNKLV